MDLSKIGSDATIMRNLIPIVSRIFFFVVFKVKADLFLVSEKIMYYRLSLIFPEKADAVARSKGGFGYIK